MTNIELRNALIDAAQNKKFTELMALLSEHSPDLNHDDFKIKADDILEKRIVVIDKDIRSPQITGSVMAVTVDGYRLAPQLFETKRGIFIVNAAGDWTFNIVSVPILQKLASGGSTSANEEIKLSYTKKVVISGVSHVLVAYVAHYCTHEDMRTILDLGCCPNSNNANSQRIGLQAANKFSHHQGLPDKYAGESRALVNAIKQNKFDMTDTLINYECPCCNGAGAKVTQNLIDLSQELNQTEVFNKLTASKGL